MEKTIGNLQVCVYSNSATITKVYNSATRKTIAIHEDEIDDLEYAVKCIKKKWEKPNE